MRQENYSIVDSKISVVKGQVGLYYRIFEIKIIGGSIILGFGKFLDMIMGVGS